MVTGRAVFVPLQNSCRFIRLSMLLCGAFLGAVGIGGCGRQAGEVAQTTPEATVTAFFNLVKDGQVDKAATAYAYEHLSRQQNSDWDDIPPGQRNLIVNTLIEEKAQKLAPWAEKINVAPGRVETVAEGDQATATVRVGERRFTVELVKEEELWKIVRVK